MTTAMTTTDTRQDVMDAEAALERAQREFVDGRVQRPAVEHAERRLDEARSREKHRKDTAQRAAAELKAAEERFAELSSMQAALASAPSQLGMQIAKLAVAFEREVASIVEQHEERVYAVDSELQTVAKRLGETLSALDPSQSAIMACNRVRYEASLGLGHLLKRGRGLVSFTNTRLDLILQPDSSCSNEQAAERGW